MTPITTRLSLLAITLTGIVTSVHHLYRLGLVFALPALVVTLGPLALIKWNQRSGSRRALRTYVGLNALIVTWFGLIDGFMDHVVKAFGRFILTPLLGRSKALEIGTSVLPHFEGDLFYELTGILTFVASIFATYYGCRLIREARSGTDSLRRQTTPSPASS